MRTAGVIVSSHLIKYPYSYFALAKELRDDLKKRLLNKIYYLSSVSGGVHEGRGNDALSVVLIERAGNICGHRHTKPCSILRYSRYQGAKPGRHAC